MSTRSLDRDVRASLALGMINNLVLRVGNLLLGIVLARLLVPEQFGVFAVALAVQAVLANLTDLGMTAYLIRSHDLERRAPTILAVGGAVGVVLALVMALLARPLATQMGSPQATPVIQVLAVTLIITGLGTVPAAIIQQRFQQGRQFVADGVSFVLGAGSAVLLITAGMGAMSLAWSRIVGQGAAVLVLFVLSGYRPRPGLDRVVLRDAYRFGLPLGGANVLSWVLINMDYVLVGRALGAATLGIYVLAFNIASWPTQAISQALRAVALPAFARADAKGSAVSRSGYVGDSVALTLAASAPVGAMLGVLALPVILFVYGGNWRASAAPLATLAAFGALRPLFDLLATYLTARGKTGPVFRVQVLWALTLLPSLWVGIELFGAAGAGLAHLAVGGLVVLPAYLFHLHRDDVSVLALLRRTVAPIVCALLAGFAAFGASRTVESPFLATLLGGLTGLGVYLPLIHRWALRSVRRLQAGGEGIVAPGALAVAEPDSLVEPQAMAPAVSTAAAAQSPLGPGQR